MYFLISPFVLSSSLDGSNSTYWSTLGVITASAQVDNPALAQHCFIKSIQLSEVSSIIIHTFKIIIVSTYTYLNITHNQLRISLLLFYSGWLFEYYLYLYYILECNRLD